MVECRRAVPRSCAGRAHLPDRYPRRRRLRSRPRDRLQRRPRLRLRSRAGHRRSQRPHRRPQHVAARRCGASAGACERIWHCCIEPARPLSDGRETPDGRLWRVIGRLVRFAHTIRLAPRGLSCPICANATVPSPLSGLRCEGASRAAAVPAGPVLQWTLWRIISPVANSSCPTGGEKW